MTRHSKAAVLRDYAVSVLWKEGQHFFHPEYFDDLDDAAATAKSIRGVYARNTQLTSKPIVSVWHRVPAVQEPMVARALGVLPLKSRKRSSTS